MNSLRTAMEVPLVSAGLLDELVTADGAGHEDQLLLASA